MLVSGTLERSNKISIQEVTSCLYNLAPLNKHGQPNEVSKTTFARMFKKIHTVDQEVSFFEILAFYAIFNFAQYTFHSREDLTFYFFFQKS